MELIKIYNGATVSARELHSFFEISERFNSWFKRMCQYGLEEGKDFTSVKTFTLVHNNAKREIDDYALTLNAAKEICMLQRSEKGKEARQYFIKCEETLDLLRQSKRFEAFLKLESSKKLLQQNVEGIGGTYEDFLQIDLAGRKILFNGKVIPDEELPTLTIKGRDFATELTNGEFTKKEMSLDSAKKINEEYHQEVRTLIERSTNIKPEELPKEERLKRLGE